MLKTAKVVGLNHDTDAALALVAAEAQPALFLIVSCSFDDAFIRTRQAIFEGQEFFYSSDLPPGQRLGETLEQIRTSLQETENLQILAAATEENQPGTVLYLLCFGDYLSAYLLREGKKSNLCDVSRGQLVSGLLQPGDRVVMATRSLIELFGDTDNLSKFPIDGLEDEVASHLPEAEPYPVAAIVLEQEAEVSFGKEKIAKIAPPVSLTAGLGKLSASLIRAVPRTRKGILKAGIFLLLVVLLGAGFIYKQKQEKAILSAFAQNYQKAVEEYQKAQSLKDTDAVAAVASLTSAKSAVLAALKIKPEDQEAQNLKKQLEEGSGEVLKIYSLQDIPLWLDLDLIKKGLSAERLSLSHGKVLILDEAQKVVVEITLSSKSQQILAGPDKLGEAKLGSLNGDVAFVYSVDKGVVNIDTKSKKVEVAAKTDPEWGNISELYGFAGNIYLLDEGKGQVWKYLPTASGYSEKRTYFKEEVRADLRGAIRLQIDSSVWVLKKGGEITKYTQGSPDFFSIGGLDKPVKDLKSFFVSDGTDYLYLLDSGNNRLVVLDKKGAYQSQYQSDKFGSFSDLVVDEKEEKVYLLDGSKIYVMELK